MSADKDFTALMLRHCMKIRQWMEGVTKAEWGKDEILRDAVCMRLFALSESAKSSLAIRKSLPAEYPAIPWDEIARFRDKTAHHYEGIDYDEVWLIVQEDLPVLIAAVEKMQADGSALGQ